LNPNQKESDKIEILTGLCIMHWLLTHC